ncbi:MAG: RnfABCDGE type electron transport complex subunit G [Vallitalea sp.]|jgi:electron transport complex protein RnfG|nr:RnfABCDGE type electron transport complex subunit G [Vallitalea sp.]
MKSNIIKDALILFAITLIAGLLLGGTYTITEEPIKDQQIKIRNKALNSVIENATFEKSTVDLENESSITELFVAKKGEDIVGYAFKLATKEGYGGVIELVVGINIDGTVSGIDITKHSETPGLGANADKDSFKNQFKGKPTQQLTVVKNGATSDTEIDSLSGATISSRAVTNAVNVAINYFNTNLSKGAQ